MQPTDTDLAITVRDGDYDRFLAIQLAPADKRPALYAVTAFNAELARVAESVSESLIGHIRLAWWREALDEIKAGATPRNHPVVNALALVHRQYPDSFTQLEQIIEARAADLDPSLLETESAWLAYLDNTAGALHYAWACILDPEHARQQQPLIIAHARAYAIVGLVRAIPYTAQQNIQRFSMQRLTEFTLDSLVPSPALNQFVKSLISETETIWDKQRYSKTLRSLTGLDRLTKSYIKHILKCEYNPYDLKNVRLSAVLQIIQVKFFLC